MEKKLICYDIDGTLTTGMLFVPLIASEHARGILSDAVYAGIADTLKAYKSGELAYEDAVQLLIEKHARGLAGQELTQVENHALEFLGSHADLLRPFGRKVIETLKHISQQIAVTAEPQYVAKAVVDYIGLDGFYASEYEVIDEKFTGNISRSLAHRSQKAILFKGSIIFAAFGDSEGDIDMLSAAQHPICVSPTDGLKVEAEAHGWLISNGVLDDALKILGRLDI